MVIGLDQLKEVKCIEPCGDGATGGEDALAEAGTEDALDSAGSADGTVGPDVGTAGDTAGTDGADAGPRSEAALDVSSDVSDTSTTDAGDGSPRCINDLSNIGAADFRISFTITTALQGNYIAVVNQRAICGPGMFWDIRINNGFLRIETDDNINPLVVFNSTNRVNDGIAHQVGITRASGTVSVAIDGTPSGSHVGTASAFAKLAPLVVADDPCEGDGGCPSNCSDGTLRLVGSVVNLCVESP
jgi:hypothetical protein